MMKTKFNYPVLMAIALLLGFSSCSNEDANDVDNGETKSVFLKVSGWAKTYGTGTPVNETQVSFVSGDLYFVNTTGTIVAHYTINLGPTTNENINLSTLVSEGETIKNLPASTAEVHVVGNTPFLPRNGNISAVKAFMLGVASQTSLVGVNLYGSAPIQLPVAPNTFYTCHINSLSPTVARIELTDIQVSTTSVITGFEVEGIFIDNYYTRASVDGTVAPVDLKYTGVDATAFNNNTLAYPTGMTPAIYDFYTTPLKAAGTPPTVGTPTAGQVWGYNLFANAAGVAIPRIIIRLSSITTGDGSLYTAPQFLTIKGMKSNGTSLTTIESGKVYHIEAGAFKFDETNLTSEPNLNAKDVKVMVTVAKWTIVPVIPEL